jgi:hypothetical protein
MEGGSKSDAAKRGQGKHPGRPGLGFQRGKAIHRQRRNTALHWERRITAFYRERRNTALDWEHWHATLDRNGRIASIHWQRRHEALDVTIQKFIFRKQRVQPE